MTEKTDLVRLLRVFVATIEGLDQNQIEDLIAGKAKLTLTHSTRSTDAANSPNADPALSPDQLGILERVNRCTDREEARRILGEVANRDALAALARGIKVHVVKHDRREDIESKIIEFVIGGRLRTEALRSLNLRGGRSAEE